MKQSVISYVPMAERYDVLVLGGGTAGVMAACAAGREGKKALILEREYALGGTATLSLTIPRMTNHIPGFVSNSSLAEELQQTLEAKKEGGDTYFCDPQMQKVELEAMCAQYGVAILYGAELVSVVKTEKQIDEVIVSTRGGLRGYRADCFVDCTGDACLARRSGCKTECGYENENQPMTLRFCVGGVDVKKVEKTLLDWGYRFGGDHFPMEFYSLWREEAFNPFTKLLRQGVNEGRLTERDGSYVQVYYHQTLGKDTLWFNCPEAGHITSAADAESVTEMILYSRKSAMRIMSFLKERFPGFEEAYIQSFADIPGIRESYRLDGEYIMTEKDIEARCRFEDAVAQSAYPIDIHNEKNLVLIHMDPGEYYEIPYRCMLPRE
ncbi:MAG: FAD-dependent oxidoreductase, partial [Christensenellales bacterium]